MTRAAASVNLDFSSEKTSFFPYGACFFFGLLMPLGFAPFHLPGMGILSLALFYHVLNTSRSKSPFLLGLLYGLGFFGFGVSWIYISIHQYGHLHGLLAAAITFLFLLYLALFPAFMALVYSRYALKEQTFYSALLFSALWILSEYARAGFLTGFPWLLLGFGQFDTPSKFLLPVLGVFGTGFITCLAACFLSHATQMQGRRRSLCLLFFVLLVLFPFSFKNMEWSKEKGEAISVGIVQANLSMRDKWDDALFWDLLKGYEKSIHELLGTQLIVLPESAIPLPPSYISDFLHRVQTASKAAGSAVLMGIPQPANLDGSHYFNSLMSLGLAKGSYFKQHLVPFGEYFPWPFEKVMDWLKLPPANLQPGHKHQTLIRVQDHPIASLICYELAYGELLRRQLPAAEWIVSISDDGWFGHSLAMYQQLQMAQVLALQAARYHVVSNNDGLSSIINPQGDIMVSLAANRADKLKADIVPSFGKTPWVRWGDKPVLGLVFILLLSCMVFFQRERRKHRQTSASLESEAVA